MPKVITAEPDIKIFTYDPSKHSFIVIASDGIFDVLSNWEVGKIIWATIKWEIKEGISLSAGEIDRLC